jgi:hypothetical protein
LDLGVPKELPMFRVAALSILFILGSTAHAAERIALKVLFVGATDTPRVKAFAEFLTERFETTKAVARDGFDPKTAADFDVVLLDWRQPDVKDIATAESPLGPRDAWNKPLVLIGSAGLLIATPWETSGGYG